MKEKSSMVLVLYIGTTKLVALRASSSPDQSIRIESWQRRESKGFEKGLVRDSEVAQQEVKEILEEIAQEKDFYQSPLYVVVSNPEIRSYQVSSSIYFQNTKTITDHDAQNVVSQTKSVATIPLDEVILWSVPQEYLVNDLPGIKNPVGLEGRRLSVTLHLFTMPVAAYRSLTHLLDCLELEPGLIIPKGMASESGILRDEEKREGVLLIEAGGALSELFYFYQGSLRYSKILSWGSESLTEKIARKWDIPPKEARRLKEEFGDLDFGAALPDESVSLVDSIGKTRLKVSAAVFQEEIMNEVQIGLKIYEREICEIRRQYKHLYQLVFSGGTTRMNGFLELVQSKINIPSRLGFVSGIQGPQELLGHSGHNAVLGLLKHVTSAQWDEREKHGSVNFFAKTVDQVKGWILDYF